MSVLMFELFLMAQSFRATTYGFGEMYCGNIGNPKPCSYGQITASGEVFDPSKATAAIPAPTSLRMTAFNIRVRNYKGECIIIRVNDKSNPRWINKRGLDLTPKAVELITGKSTPHWSGVLNFCTSD